MKRNHRSEFEAASRTLPAPLGNSSVLTTARWSEGTAVLVLLQQTLRIWTISDALRLRAATRLLLIREAETSPSANAMRLLRRSGFRTVRRAAESCPRVPRWRRADRSRGVAAKSS